MRGDDRMKLHGLSGNRLVYFTSVFVSLGVFLFGYDQGVMSGIITGSYFKDYFNQPTRAEIGTMVAILEVGALFSSLIVGRAADMLGRCRTIRYGSWVFCVGGFIQTVATSTTWMIIGRVIAGLGVGALTTIVPVYQSEISSEKNRGLLACIEFSGNILGYSSSVWVGYFSSYLMSDWSWRLPLSLQVIMGLLLGVGSFVLPESPRWLLDTDQKDEAALVIGNIYGKGDIKHAKAEAVFKDISTSIMRQRELQEDVGYRYMFRKYRSRVLIAMSAQMFAQLNGINVISYYAPLVFEQAGWVGRSAILMTGINSITYLLSTFVPWYAADRAGRIPLLVYGAAVMVVSLCAISTFMYIGTGWTPTMVVVMVMVYNAAFGMSWGPIPWLYPPEILPLSIRSMGASLSTATNWLFNWVVGQTTPVFQEWFHWRLYLIHALSCMISIVVVKKWYRETANRKLEDMDELFGDGSDPTVNPENGNVSGHDSTTPLLGDGSDRQSGRSGSGPDVGPDTPSVTPAGEPGSEGLFSRLWGRRGTSEGYRQLPGST